MLQHTASSTQQQKWKEQNVLKIDMEVVVCDVEQWTVEKVMDVICMVRKTGRHVY
jgi:nitrogen regulatory protein PII